MRNKHHHHDKCKWPKTKSQMNWTPNLQDSAGTTVAVGRTAWDYKPEWSGPVMESDHLLSKNNCCRSLYPNLWFSSCTRFYIQVVFHVMKGRVIWQPKNRIECNWRCRSRMMKGDGSWDEIGKWITLNCWYLFWKRFRETPWNASLFCVKRKEPLTRQLTLI